LVEDLKHLRAGKYVTQLREPINMPQQPAGGNKALQKNYNANSSRIIAGDFHRDKDRDDTDSELGGLNDDNDNASTSSEKYERDVTVLNHCFDDIEKFIARLQHSAAALRELERRRRNRKSKKKDPGEGLLTLRTRPPHEKEFIDIFAKFKLSFNLLAKLKAHIHDPNAPELVHFLFTPLALIVDASHETYYDPNLPARVIHPLLTSDAINLLINCVTSKETELWRSLGDAWVVPRDQWKGNISSYHPVFFDGWSPEYPVIDELEQPSTPTNLQQRRRIPSVMGGSGVNDGRSQDYGPADYSGEYSMDQPPSAVGHHESRLAGGQQQQMPPVSPGLRDFGARSDISIDSIERNGKLF
jgi:epidermal growth factor receptor kinase substrate 8